MVSVVDSTVTSDDCAPISRLRFRTGLSVMLMVTDGTVAVLKPEAENFTL
jgi:hypothetical protein